MARIESLGVGSTITACAEHQPLEQSLFCLSLSLNIFSYPWSTEITFGRLSINPPISGDDADADNDAETSSTIFIRAPS